MAKNNRIAVLVGLAVALDRSGKVFTNVLSTIVYDADSSKDKEKITRYAELLAQGEVTINNVSCKQQVSINFCDPVKVSSLTVK